MSKFNASKDKIIFETTTPSGIVLGIYKYDEGDPKFGMTRTYEDNHGKMQRAKAGRLTWEEFQDVKKALDKIEDMFDGA